MAVACDRQIAAYRGPQHPEPSGMGYLDLLASWDSSGTVDELQSASKAIYHSSLSESLAGRSPSWLSEGGRPGTETETGTGTGWGECGYNV